MASIMIVSTLPCSQLDYGLLLGHFILFIYFLSFMLTTLLFFYVSMTMHHNRLKGIKSTDALNSNFIGMMTLRVSGSLSAHHQEF